MTTSTVELKTSRPGVTKTEQIKTGYSNVNEYSKYLQGKYHYMNIGLTSMPVSYTHLDVYKRQLLRVPVFNSSSAHISSNSPIVIFSDFAMNFLLS